jgi:hypothetical protein
MSFSYIFCGFGIFKHGAGRVNRRNLPDAQRMRLCQIGGRIGLVLTGSRHQDPGIRRGLGVVMGVGF